MAEPKTLPLLAVVYTADAFAVLRLTDAAAGVCRLLWIIDSREPRVEASRRLMARFGDVVDVAGLDVVDVVDLIAPLAPQGIVTFTDDGQRFTAELAQRLGLEFHSAEVVERLIDKVAQRTALREAGFPTPGFWEVTKDSVASVVDQVRAADAFPVVVKPRSGAASRDTYLADDADALAAILDESRDVDMIVEEFLPDLTPAGEQDFADFVSVESVVLCGEVKHLAVTGRFPLAAPFRGSGMFIPSHLPPALIDEIEALAADSALALGVRSGVMHTEIKVTPDGPRIIEVNGRVGGGVPDILRLLGGIPIVSWRMRLALGIDLPLADYAGFDRVGFFLWHQPPIGAVRVLAVDGLDVAAEIPGVEEVRPVRNAGDPVDWRDGGVGHVFGIGGVVDSYEELVEVRRRILETTSVEYSYDCD